MVQLPVRQANNFDLLRILFAWFVIVSHSYVLNGDGATDPLFVATNSTFLFSFIGVKGFFIISGYLIFKSMMVSTSIFEYLVKTYTNEGDLVLDNCAGSGTTGVACRNLNRNFIQIEISPEYCKIAEARLKQGILNF
jgi:hypothetical protein